MSSTYSLRMRDPIHGLIYFSELEERVINSWPLQRLRGIRQLAMAYLGYPGAVHTRFDHSIGTMHVAGRMIDALRPYFPDRGIEGMDFETAKATVRLAGLLHDVGHGPFSHVSDAALDLMSGKRTQDLGLDRSKLHELVTLDIIRCSEEISECLGDEERERVCRLLDPTRRDRSVLRDIVSGSLDADKLDYLLRDSYFAGVRYGIVDLERILACLRLFEEKDKDKSTFLAIDEEGLFPVEQLVLARYHMTLQVYLHKIRRITDALLRRCLQFACDPDEGIPEVRKLYDYTPSRINGSASREFVARYITYDDTKLLHILAASEECFRARRIAQALQRRQLPREVFHATFDDLKDMKIGAVTLSKLDDTEAAGVSKLEREIAERLGLTEDERDFVVVDIQKVSAEAPSAPGAQVDIDELFVFKGGVEHKFADRSRIFEHKGKAIPEHFLSVFVPLSGNRTQRQDQRRGVIEVVEEILRAQGGGSE